MAIPIGTAVTASPITVEIEDVTVAAPSSGVTSGTFDVLATAGDGSEPLGTFDLVLDVDPEVTITGFTLVAPFDSPGFPVTLTPTGPNEFSLSYGSLSGTSEVTTDTVLIQIDFAVDEGELGDFAVDFDPASGLLGGSSGFTLLTDSVFVGGTISVIPEPASLALLAAGGCLMLSRRRRQTS
ncbi:MAG: PEP-CTERM sorting domain-containing protein [Planctomycetota bacterium]